MYRRTCVCKFNRVAIPLQNGDTIWSEEIRKDVQTQLDPYFTNNNLNTSHINGTKNPADDITLENGESSGNPSWAFKMGASQQHSQCNKLQNERSGQRLSTSSSYLKKDESQNDMPTFPPESQLTSG